MSWIAVDKKGDECIYVRVPKSTSEELTGKPMSWEDVPRESK